MDRIENVILDMKSKLGANLLPRLGHMNITFASDSGLERIVFVT
jgi:hypothetical protein